MNWISIITLTTAFIIGLSIVLFKESNILWIGLAGMALAIFYSLPPFQFAYKGLGEVVVAVTFGPLMVSGVYVLMAGTIDWSPILVSIPIAFLIANVLWINQYPDYEADVKGNKRNGVVRLGKEKGIIVYALLFILAYAMFIVLAVYFQNPLWIFGFMTAPIAFKAVSIAKREYNNTQKLVPANEKTVQIFMLNGIIMFLLTLSNLLF
ncbi:MAG: prenyltransferase [Bacillus sp. (in: Bacteria)]|nr:prenyltransferase [Bacillus sp. (in: firmicutes)]